MKAFETVTVTDTVTSLNVEVYRAGLEKSNHALMAVEAASIRFTTDGSQPIAASRGILANDGDIIELTSYNEVKLFRAVRTGAVSATLQVDYS